MTINASETASFMRYLADIAAEIAQKHFGMPLSHELKSDASPVTIADKEIEMALVEQIRKTYPEHGIYGEETARINPQAPLQWVIDPIDGTRAFMAGKPTFVTLVALCEDEVPQMGLISQPIKRKRWLASAQNTANASANEASTLADAHIATTSIPYFSAAEATAFARLEKATSTCLLNHDGLAAGMLADGDVDILIEAKLKPYDFCALVPVIQQAGGTITDWQGHPITMQSDGHILAAKTPQLHAKALEITTA